MKIVLLSICLLLIACTPATPTADVERLRRSPTPTATATRTRRPSVTPTSSPTSTPSSTPTSSPTSTFTATATPWPTSTPAPVLNIGAGYSAALATWFNTHCLPGDVIIFQRAADLPGITCGDRQILFSSVATAEQQLPSIMAGDRSPTIVGYDFEHWPLTPDNEQADAVSAVRRMRALADRYGLVLLFAPDRAYGMTLAESIAPLVDRWALQLQLFHIDADDIGNYANPLIDRLRSVNPNIQLTMQFQAADVEGIEEVIESLPAAHRPIVVSLLYQNYLDVVALSDELRISPKESMP